MMHTGLVIDSGHGGVELVMYKVFSYGRAGSSVGCRDTAVPGHADRPFGCCASSRCFPRPRLLWF